MKTKIARLVLCLVLAGSVSTGWTAAPPSDRTEDEVLWQSLSRAAGADITSDETHRLMQRFLQAYPDHPKAVRVLYMEGERQFKKANYKEAAVHFEQFLSRHGQHSLADSAAFRLGECYYNLKVYNSAFEAWSQMARRYRDSSLVPDAQERLIALLMRGGEWGKADEEMNRLKAQYPGFAQADRVRERDGVILYHLDDYLDSAKRLEGVERDMAAYFRGLSLFSLKLYEDAVAALKNVDAEKSGVYVESGAFLKAEGFFQKRNYNVAAGEFRAFMARFPGSALLPYAHLRVAASDLLAKDPASALTVVDTVLKKSAPKDVETYGLFIKACAFMDQNKFGPAADLLAKVAAQDEYPDLAASALARKAWAHKNLGQNAAFETSLKRLEEKFPASPHMALAQFLHGANHFENRRWEDAGARFEAAVIRYPYSILSEAGLALMSIAYTRANRLDHLITAANSALKIFEENYSSLSPFWRAQAYYFIGKAYYDMAKYKEALPFLEKVTIGFSDHPLAPHSELLLAWCLLEENQYEKARQKAEGLIENKKTQADIAVNAQFLRAVTFFNAKQYDKSLAHLSTFVKDHPKDDLAPEARYLMGLSYYQKGVFGSAIEEWTRCIEDYPNHALAKDAYLYIGDLYFKAGKYDLAAKSFKRFQERWPSTKYGEVAAWQELQSYFNGKDDEAAIKAYPVFLRKYPNSENKADAERQLEMVYYRRGADGHPAKLEEFLAKYPKSPFAPSARYKLGDMAMEQKKWGRAAMEMEQFVRDYPNDALAMEAVYALGQAYENLNETDKAIIQYRSIMDQFASKPVSVDAAFRLGMLHFGRERYQEAVEAFVFASKKKMPAELKANLTHNMALCYENLGQLENAAAAYGQFTKYSNNKDQVREALMTAGLLLKKAEKPAQAAGYFGRLLKDPGSEKTALEALNLLAESHRAAGNTAKAIQTYEKLLGMQPASHDLRLAGLAQLAYLYEQQNNAAKAVRVYEKIAISEGKPEWVKAAKERVQVLTQKMEPAP